MKPRSAIFILFLLLTSSVQADLTVASIFSDHAVVQRDRPLMIWGTATPLQSVAVVFGSSTADTSADATGRWRVVLTPQPASAVPLMLNVTAGSETIQRADIVIGDVWHASGQSNMGMTVGSVAKSLAEVQEQLSAFDFPHIRFARINDGPSRQPLEELTAPPKWTVCSPDTVTSFSAAAFFFAKKLHTELDVPIGIINTARGGTPIEPFIPYSAFTGHPTLIRERELGDNDDLEGIWRLPGGVRARSDTWLPGRLFHSRVAPIKDYAVRGCVWYQGESNCGDREDPRDYQHKMRALIRGWRRELDQKNLPFYFVQLPGSGAGANWPYLREQQRLCADIPNTGMVVTIDLEHPDIHPPNKVDVGNRLAGWALAKQYDRSVPFSGPLFSKATVNGRSVIVEFDHTKSGLMVAAKTGLQPPTESSAQPLNHFELIGDDGTWHPALAEISGQTVAVRSKQVDHPVAVRYAYDVAPKSCNLFNGDGLPASPFCSRPELLKCDPGLPK